MTKFEEALRSMTIEEKFAVLAECFNGQLDINQIKADQRAIGAPDSALDDGLLRLAAKVGALLGREVATVQDLVEAMKGRFGWPGLTRKA